MRIALAPALALGLVTVGAAGVVAPRLSAAQFGLPADDPAALAYVRATGARDVVLGAIVFASLRDRAALRRVLAWTSGIALADALILAGARGLCPHHVLHGGGFAALALAALLLND